MSLLRYIYDRLRPASIVDGMDIVFGRDPKSGVYVAVIQQSDGRDIILSKCTLGFLGNNNYQAAAYIIYFGKTGALHMFMSEDDFGKYTKAHNDKITKIERFTKDGIEMRPTSGETL